MSSCHHHSCCNSSCGCQSKGCSCSCHQSHSGSHKSCGCESHERGCGSHYAEKFLEMADHAWMEVLKEKIKDHIRSNAKNMDDLARIISEANHERWQTKMENKQCCGGYEERLKEFFNHSCHHKNEQ